MNEAIYRAMTAAIDPIGPAAMAVARPGDYRERSERLARYGPLSMDSPIWVHAASTGEMEGAVPLIREIRRRVPGSEFVLSAMTSSGRERASKVDGVTPLFAPIDLPGPIARAFDAISPSLLILVETEIWPNLLVEANRRDCPVTIASGRVSEKAFRRMKWIQSLYRKSLSRIRLIGAQRAVDGERFRAFGVSPDKIFIHGNTKIDSMPTHPELPFPRESGKRWVVFGSVRPAEEQAVFRAARWIREQVPDTVIVAAPRHPERSGGPPRSGNVDWSRWSKGVVPEGSTAIWVETVGVLAALYTEAEVAFVGGSLSDHGGHNPIEAARWGVPVLMGPNIDHCREFFELLEEAGAAESIGSGEELGPRIVELLRDGGARNRMSAAARDAVNAHRGASARAVDRFEADGLLRPSRNTP